MVELSQNELKAIAAHSVRKGLETFRTTFASRYLRSENADVTEVVDRLTSEAFDRGEKDVILDLILAVLAQPAARIIRSRIGDRPLAGDIASLYARLSADQEHAKPVAPLLKLVLTPKSGVAPQNSDADIWTAVLDLIAYTKPLQLPQPTTPTQSHPSFISSFQQTPWSFNTGGFEDTSEHRKQVDDALKQELLPSLRIDIPDFIDAVFKCVPLLDELAKAVFELCVEGDVPLYTEGSGWARWPRSAKEELVLEWLQELVGRFTVWVNERGVHAAARRQIYQGPGIYLEGSPVKRKMDVGITARHGESKDDVDRAGEKTNTPISDWAEILVAGELKSNPIEDGQTPAWLDLARYAREVFRSQDRRFVLGFSLCGSVMRLWHFDRSGSSGSSSFDINKDGFKFTRVMLGYVLMNNEQLGLDPTIRQLDGKRYMEITRNGKIERLILTEDITKQAVIVGRATTCWRAYCDGDGSEEPLVVKDSWQYEERPEEGELIKVATDEGVRNIARYYHHETVQVGGKNDDTLENVRKGLMKTCGRTTFRQRSFKEPGMPVSGSLGKAMAGRGQSQSLSRKRSSSSAQMAPPANKKRSSSSAQMAPPANKKRSRSSRRSKDTGTPTHNRVHRRVITKDAGKPIYKALSPVAIINGFIGAIHGHESLLNAGILHRDISIGNIMLTKNEDSGFLIDLDLANKTSDDQASGAPSKTGTKIFMAIGALLGEPHSFMHDLESFFWVLFWICIHYDGRNEKGEVKRKIVSKYEKWNYADTEELADSKTAMVVEDERFNKTIAGFTPTCQPLAPCVRDLRRYIFPDGKRWLGENKELYPQIETVLEKAKKDLELRAMELC